MRCSSLLHRVGAIEECRMGKCILLMLKSLLRDDTDELNGRSPASMARVRCMRGREESVC